MITHTYGLDDASMGFQVKDKRIKTQINLWWYKIYFTIKLYICRYTGSLSLNWTTCFDIFIIG